MSHTYTNTYYTTNTHIYKNMIHLQNCQNNIKMNLLLLQLLLLLLSIQITSTFSLNQEGLYLLQAKLSMTDSTNSLYNWNSTDHSPCINNWTNIHCTSNSTVLSINLQNLSLSATTFPIHFCKLKSLHFLSLAFNNFNSSIPKNIHLCRTLVSLDISQNLFHGEIPGSLARMENLEYLNLEGNGFIGNVPREFGSFRKLEVLNLVNNLLDGKVLGRLGNVTSLREIRMAYNGFEMSEIDSGWGDLYNLESLWISGCNLVGGVPVEFGKLKRLRNFDVSNNRLTGPIPKAIFGMKSIIQIELFNNLFSGEIPKHGWEKIPGLRRFDASANRLTGLIPNELCELPLESLGLEDNQLVGPLPESIAKSPNLYELRLFNNSLNGSLPSQLGRNSQLQVIDVSANQFSGEFPPYLCAKGALEELILINNSFSGAFPSVYGKCRTLTRVRLRGNRFSGEFPSEVWGLPHVSLLDIGENLFSGHISRMIASASNISVIDISHSKFSGRIPDEIGLLSNLVVFLASDNELSGPIPSTITNLGKLSMLDLSSNLLSGTLPEGLQSLKQLNGLNLANNSLAGEISAEIGSFPMLNYLDLSYNQFSGEIPLDLQNLKLNALNLSYNHLWGNIPPQYATDGYKDSFIGNPGLCGYLPSLCKEKSRGMNPTEVWITITVSTVILLIVLLGFSIVFLKWLKVMETHKYTTIMKWSSFHKLELSENEILNCLTEENIIGSGGSGKVYKAELNNGEVVAVKKLCTRVENEMDTFETEVQMLGKIRHKNIVRLWCCCSAADCKLLVYEYMPNGSLGDLLHRNKGRLLDWPMRLRIALDAADGLSYLHHDCVPVIVHRDVKPNNILLDEDFGARISDFGVAKVVKLAKKGAESMSAIAGSCGYIAPEYAYTLRVTEKSDIYSFGVVILELLTGKRPIDPELGEKHVVTWVCNNLDQKGVDYVLDQNLEYSIYKEQICKVLDIALLCVSALPINRPSMQRVVKMLQDAGAAKA